MKYFDSLKERRKDLARMAPDRVNRQLMEIPERIERETALLERQEKELDAQENATLAIRAVLNVAPEYEHQLNEDIQALSVAGIRCSDAVFGTRERIEDLNRDLESRRSDHEALLAFIGEANTI